MSPSGARRFAIGAVAVAVVVWVGAAFLPSGEPDSLNVTLLTQLVGEGVSVGTVVRLAGVQVGSVESIEPAGNGRQRISLALMQSRTGGLTDDGVGVDYVPGNLFGISEIDLTSGPGGAELTDNALIDLTGANADRVRDATLSSLLRSIGVLGTDVLTPDLGSVLHQIASNTKAFTPIIDALVVTLTAVADTQRYPSSFLLNEFGSALHGSAALVEGLVRLLGTANDIEYLSADERRIKFDDTFTMIREELVPALTETLTTGNTYFRGYVPMLVPLLDTVTASVRKPQRTGAELGEFLDRLGRSFHDSPHGPVLFLNVDFGIVPAVATPLFGAGLPADVAGGR